MVELAGSRCPSIIRNKQSPSPNGQPLTSLFRSFICLFSPSVLLTGLALLLTGLVLLLTGLVLLLTGLVLLLTGLVLLLTGLVLLLAGLVLLLRLATCRDYHQSKIKIILSLLFHPVYPRHPRRLH